VLLHLIDAYTDDVSAAYKTIMQELKDYRVDLTSRPQVVALTKIEGVDKKQLNAKLRKLSKLVPKDTPVLAFSSLTREGLSETLRVVQKQVERARRAKAKEKPAEELPVIGLRPSETDWQIEKTEGGFVITGRQIERFAARTKFGDQHSEERLRDILKKRGIIRQLERQGIEPDQTITIGNPPIGELEY